MLAGVTALCLAPAGIAALPTSARNVPAEQLRDQVLQSAALPYQGIAQSDGGVRLPALDEFGDLTGLFGGRHDDACLVRLAGRVAGRCRHADG